MFKIETGLKLVLSSSAAVRRQPPAGRGRLQPASQRRKFKYLNVFPTKACFFKSDISSFNQKTFHDSAIFSHDLEHILVLL